MNSSECAPDERVIGAIDDDELGTGDAAVEHLRVMHRHPLIVRSGDHERRTSDLGRRFLLSNTIISLHAISISLRSWSL